MEKQVDLASDPDLGPEHDSTGRDRVLSENILSYRRDRYVTDRNFQYKFAFTWLLATIIFLSLIIVQMFWTSDYSLGVPREQIWEYISAMLPYTGPFALLLCVFFFVYFLTLSHRISGPVSRLRKKLLKLARWDFSVESDIRDTDYLQDIADGINQVAESLQDRKDQLESIQKKMDSLETHLEEQAGENKETLDLCETIQEELNDLRGYRPLEEQKSESGEENQA